MSKKIIFLSILAAGIVLMAGFIPALASPKNDFLSIKNDLVTIEVNYYLGRQPKQIQTLVTADEAEEIRQYLSELYDAQIRNDHKAIQKYESLLNEKGIFGESYQKFYSIDTGMILIEKIKIPGHSTQLADDDNISNRLCFFNAIGEGLVAWGFALTIWEAIMNMIRNTSSFIVALILLLTFLPFFVIVMLLTNLIPFRILAPKGLLSLKNGTISSFGLNGIQRVTVGEDSYSVTISGFTGLTINIPPMNNRKSFLFISGFALQVEG